MAYLTENGGLTVACDLYSRAYAIPPTLFRALEASRGPHEWLLEPSGGGLWGSRGRLVASWELLGDLGAVLGCHGAVLGHSWRRLVILLEPLEVILRSSWALLGAS